MHQFHRHEHIVTAFLSISGASEACLLPFLCLHLTQLGVSPLQAGLCVSAFLLLRGVASVLWWRSLRQRRKNGRRRVAVLCGVLVSVAVMLALAAIPPSIGCQETVQSLVSPPQSSLESSIVGASVNPDAQGKLMMHHDQQAAHNVNQNDVEDIHAHSNHNDEDGSLWSTGGHQGETRPHIPQVSNHHDDVERPAASGSVSDTTNDEVSEPVNDESTDAVATTESPLLPNSAAESTNDHFEHLDDVNANNEHANLQTSVQPHPTMSAGSHSDANLPATHSATTAVPSSTLSSEVPTGEIEPSVVPKNSSQLVEHSQVSIFPKPNSIHHAPVLNGHPYPHHRTTKPPQYHQSELPAHHSQPGHGNKHLRPNHPQWGIPAGELNTELPLLSRTTRSTSPPDRGELSAQHSELETDPLYVEDEPSEVEADRGDPGLDVDAMASDELPDSAQASNVDADVEDVAKHPQPNVPPGSDYDEAHPEMSASNGKDTFSEGNSGADSGLQYPAQQELQNNFDGDDDADLSSQETNLAEMDEDGSISIVAQDHDGGSTTGIDYGSVEEDTEGGQSPTKVITADDDIADSYEDTSEFYSVVDDDAARVSTSLRTAVHAILPQPTSTAGYLFAKPGAEEKESDREPIEVDPSGISSDRRLYQTAVPRTCIEFSQLQIPFDPMKYPDGVVVCDPAHPETSRVKSQGGHPQQFPNAATYSGLREPRHGYGQSKPAETLLNFNNKSLLHDASSSARHVGFRNSHQLQAMNTDSYATTHIPVDLSRSAVIESRNPVPLLYPRTTVVGRESYRIEPSEARSELKKVHTKENYGQESSSSETEINTTTHVNRLPSHSRRRNKHRGRASAKDHRHNHIDRRIGNSQVSAHKSNLATTTEAASMWSLSQAIKKLEQMSPTLSRLLGGKHVSKKRRTVERQLHQLKSSGQPQHHRRLSPERSVPRNISGAQDEEYHSLHIGRALLSVSDSETPSSKAMSKSEHKAEPLQDIQVGPQSVMRAALIPPAVSTSLMGFSHARSPSLRSRRRTVYRKILPEWPSEESAVGGEGKAHHYPVLANGNRIAPKHRVIPTALSYLNPKQSIPALHSKHAPSSLHDELAEKPSIVFASGDVNSGNSDGELDTRTNHASVASRVAHTSVAKSSQNRHISRPSHIEPSRHFTSQHESDIDTETKYRVGKVPDQSNGQRTHARAAISVSGATNSLVTDARTLPHSGNVTTRSEPRRPGRFSPGAGGGAGGFYTRLEVHGSITYRFTSMISPLDPYLLFLLTMGLLSVYGVLGAPYRHLVAQSWRLTLDEAEHLERSGRHLSTADVTSASLLAAAAALAAFLPDCVLGRRPLAAVLAVGAVTALLNVLLVPWLPLIGGKAPPPRLRVVTRTLISSRSTRLFTSAVFSMGAMTSAEFNFLLPYSAARWPQPTFVLLLTVAVALVSRLPVRAVHKPVMTRIGFVGTVVLAFSALSARCLCYLCLPSQWGLLPAQLLSGLSETLFWLALLVFVDKTAHLGHERTTLWLLDGVYTAGRGAGVGVAGLLFGALGATAALALLATAAAGAALGYYVIARFSADSPDLAYSKLPSDDVTVPMTSWTLDSGDDEADILENVSPTADNDWLERAMIKEGLL